MNESTVRQDACYLSTPSHIRSLRGRLLYIYTDKGTVRLTGTSIAFEGKKQSLVIELATITAVGIGQYPRGAKPIPLNYLSLTYDQDGDRKTVLLTPTLSWTTPVWDTNKMVATWQDLLDKSVERISSEKAKNA